MLAHALCCKSSTGHSGCCMRPDPKLENGRVHSSGSCSGMQAEREEREGRGAPKQTCLSSLELDAPSRPHQPALVRISVHWLVPRHSMATACAILVSAVSTVSAWSVQGSSVPSDVLGSWDVQDCFTLRCRASEAFIQLMEQQGLWQDFGQKVDLCARSELMELLWTLL